MSILSQSYQKCGCLLKIADIFSDSLKLSEISILGEKYENQRLSVKRIKSMSKLSKKWNFGKNCRKYRFVSKLSKMSIEG